MAKSGKNIRMLYFLCIFENHSRSKIGNFQYPITTGIESHWILKIVPYYLQHVPYEIKQ
jgi:hypothetical protein